jgi:hypothetical protein
LTKWGGGSIIIKNFIFLYNMMSIEFKQDLTEIKEIDWVTDQVKTELQ